MFWPWRDEAADRLASLRSALRLSTLHFGGYVEADYMVSPEDFVRETRGNTTVETVFWSEQTSVSTVSTGEVDWNSMGQGLGHLENLRKMLICSISSRQEFGVYWEGLRVVLPYMKQEGLHLEICSPFVSSQERGLLSEAEITAVKEAFRGHPTIEHVTFSGIGRFGWFREMVSALASLPSLQEVSLKRRIQESQAPLEDPGSLTTLLRMASLWKVNFILFTFSNEACEALAAGIREATTIQEVCFAYCSFRTRNSHVVGQALERNTSLTKIEFTDCDFSQGAFESLASAVRCNTTLTSLVLSVQHGENEEDESVWSTPVFEALGTNATLKTLRLSKIRGVNPVLREAIRVGLSTNSTLEHLQLVRCWGVNAEEDIDSWSAILPFLRDNSSLKSVHIEFTTFCQALYTDALSMLADQSVLEELELSTCRNTRLAITDCCNILQRLHPNKSLKRLCIGTDIIDPDADDDDAVVSFNKEKERLVSILSENYYLQELDCSKWKAVDDILTLNKAGRCYLVEDASSSRKGVAVLSAVCNDLDCIYFHILENPSICKIDHELSESASRPQTRPRTLS